jgi:hypothetical protein
MRSVQQTRLLDASSSCFYMLFTVDNSIVRQTVEKEKKTLIHLAGYLHSILIEIAKSVYLNTELNDKSKSR